MVPNPCIDPYVLFLIRRQVRGLVGHHGFGPSDREDLAQELALHVHLAAPAYRRARGAASTFFDRVIRRRAISLAQARAVKKRDRRREQPLDAAATHPAKNAAQPTLELKLDVQDAVLRLPQCLRDLASHFMEHDEGELAAGRALALTRGQVRHRRTLIARELCAVGLGPEEGQQ